MFAKQDVRIRAAAHAVWHSPFHGRVGRSIPDQQSVPPPHCILHCSELVIVGELLRRSPVEILEDVVCWLIPMKPIAPAMIQAGPSTPSIGSPCQGRMSCWDLTGCSPLPSMVSPQRNAVHGGRAILVTPDVKLNPPRKRSRRMRGSKIEASFKDAWAHRLLREMTARSTRPSGITLTGGRRRGHHAADGA